LLLLLPQLLLQYGARESASGPHVPALLIDRTGRVSKAGVFPASLFPAALFLELELGLELCWSPLLVTLLRVRNLSLTLSNAVMVKLIGKSIASLAEFLSTG